MEYETESTGVIGETEATVYIVRMNSEIRCHIVQYLNSQYTHQWEETKGKSTE